MEDLFLEKPDTIICKPEYEERANRIIAEERSELKIMLNLFDGCYKNE